MRQAALRRESLADQAVVAIQQLIVDGALEPGDQLPSTGELAERFGVSRTVVREALAALAGRGLITRRQGRESVVADPGVHQLRELLELHVRRSGATTGVVVELRCCLEAEGARLAAARSTDEQRRQLLAAIEVPAAGQSAHDGDRDFHRGLLAASRNPLLTLLLDVLGEPPDETRPVPGPDGCATTGRPRDEHLAILKAVDRGDGDGAADAMRQHLSGPDTR